MFSHCNIAVSPNKLTQKVQSRLTIASVSVEDGGVMQDCHPVSVGGKPPRTSSSSPESKETKDQSQSKVKSDHLQISWYLDSSSAAAAEEDGKAEESSGFQGCGWNDICLKIADSFKSNFSFWYWKSLKFTRVQIVLQWHFNFQLDLPDPPSVVVEMRTGTGVEEDNISLVNVPPAESPTIEQLLSGWVELFLIQTLCDGAQCIF